MGEQLPLRWDGQTAYQAWWRRVLGEMDRAVEFITLKQAAFDLDMKASGLAHALAERDNRHPRAEWIPYLVSKAPDFELARALVAPAGLVVEQAPQHTPEDECIAWRAAVSELPVDFRHALENRMRTWRRNGGGAR